MCIHIYIYIYIYTHTHAYRDWGGWGWANLNKVQLGGFWTKQFVMLEFMYKMRLLTFFRTRLKSSSSLLFYIYIYIYLIAISFSDVAGLLFVFGFSLLK